MHAARFALRLAGEQVDFVAQKQAVVVLLVRVRLRWSIGPLGERPVLGDLTQ
jgi:hypothetical protein